MKKLLLPFLFLAALVCAAPAFAVCPSSITIKDGTGASVNMATGDDGSGNCVAKTAFASQPTVGLAIPATVAYGVTTAASTNCANIKNSSGTLWLASAINPTTTAAFARFYDKATTPVPGTDSSLVKGVAWIIPPGTTGPTTYNGFITMLPAGLTFSAGIGVCVTGANGNSDATNAVAGINVNVVYQ